MAPPAPASALHRHQSSLEGILDFSSQPPLDPAHRASAKRRFDQIINHFECEGIRPGRDKYDRVKLVSLTYDHSTSEKSKDRLLAAFFAFAGLSITAHEDIDFEDPTRQDELRASLDNFADYLFDNFFLPLKASTKKTPQPSPASHSAVTSNNTK
ncbi:HNHc domain-containing protein [Fusarium sp. LHS14.1]|nr:HNHc domain-containing protein [Fusarium sp. LHS14.1]